MITTEALRLQLDNLQKEKQELEVKNYLKFSENPSKEVLRDIEKERDHWKDKCERITVEKEKLLYEGSYLRVKLILLTLAQISKLLLSYRSN